MSEPKKPQDHKKPADTLYEWATPDGQVIRLKPFGRIPSGVVRKARNLSNLEQTIALIEAGVDDEGQELVDALALEELDKLLEDWAGDVAYPQSSSSSNS